MTTLRWRLAVLLAPLLLPWLLLLGAAPPVPAAPARMRVVFLDALETGSAFQRQFRGAMNAAAHDLDIELIHIEMAHWPGEILEQARRAVSGPDKPDYLIISIHRDIGARVLEVAEQAQVPVFVVNSGLGLEERARFGGPREHFARWIGQMVPDDVGAGERLVRMLVDAAHARGRSSPEGPMEGPVRLIAIEGQLGDTSAKQRRLGLRQALSGAKDVELLQGVTAAWRREESRRKTLLLLRRYPELQAVWAANDDLALGAARALEEAGRHPGEDVLVGGIDWTPEALEAVREGRLVTSLGGHFLEGAWALVLLYDHHRGRDFASERLNWSTAFLPATRANASDYLEVLARPDWEAFDFRAFSKAANPRLRHYAFSPQALFAQRHGRMDPNGNP
ncbi:substrate-binding domain-containing protein [Cystobacter fuscus]|uniref:ABC transporter substrate-binding protein n=1 Tax=Cystobacter fuscus TaxID=43 RepID=UPI002B2BB7C0|nr:substrate-binding domain-containing protein [Cystobacter fuscus]